MSISVSGTRPLDTESASSSWGTGFVVDKKRGLLLTNRHMVHVGPVRAQGTTLNHEEVELLPVYRDPVHDFGFYRFDPSQIRYMELEELELEPDAAMVGVEIRVVGNDAGEKLSILDGTLARLDRPAPDYGLSSYNDFNTFYYQAATSTSGGSSGSPVVDIEGRALALNAGGSISAASSYYLPIQRAMRVLEHLQKGEPIPRGTIQAIFNYEPFDELRRLGLAPETERSFRQLYPSATGMLVVREIIPEGPAAQSLRPGDILLSIDGERVSCFHDVETELDASVGQQVSIIVERGGKRIETSIGVSDLHSLTPSRYLEFSQGILQETSLQMARNHIVPARGVLLVEPGYAFRRARIWNNSIIMSLDDQPVEDLDDMVAVLERLPDGKRVRVRYKDIDNPWQEKLGTLVVDRHWARARLCQRNDASGLWDCRELATPPPSTPEKRPQPSATFEKVNDPVAAIIAPSLCHIRFTIPYRTEGVEGWSYVGTGLVVDATKGIVVTDRGTVPIGLGDVELTFAGSVRVSARVEYLHPIHNIAVIRYDPSSLGSIPVRTATLSKDADLDAGTEVHQVCLTSSQRVVHKKTTISRVDFVGTDIHSPPSFREYNSELYKLADSASSIGGVLADDKGQVVALWTFQVEGGDSGRFRGLPVDLVRQVVEPFKRGDTPQIRDLGIEIAPISLADARDQGMPDHWVARLAASDPQRRQAITVVRILPEVSASHVLQGGDIILAIDEQPITRPIHLEQSLALDGETVTITRLRDGTVEPVQAKPLILDGRGPDRMVMFAGALFHEPHWQVKLQYNPQPGGLYVSWYWYGGPAAYYGLRASSLVRAVDDTPINNLDDFLSIIENLPDKAPVRLQVENLSGATQVTTMETDMVYWPSMVFEADEGQWTLRELSAFSP